MKQRTAWIAIGLVGMVLATTIARRPPATARDVGDQFGPTPSSDAPSPDTRPDEERQPGPTRPADGQPRFRVENIRGRVLFAGESLEKQLGIELVEEAKDRLLVLEDADGRVLPLIEDLRVRAFRRDPRLRERELELTVRRYERAPMLQILRVYALEKGKKLEVDYWCEICAIPMYELQPCQCCQGPIELRFRPVP